MCGIAGVIALDGQVVDEGLLQRMTSAVKHRGPDGEGILVEANVGLGHRRLAIVDLSPDGLQPMTSRNGRISVTYNGEIYNYIELRKELESVGHEFYTSTDTEVLIAAYVQWGTQCVSKFNGMWSFAIYDRERGLLFCSRDRFGKKPFYYLRNRRNFAFGSEIRQLLPLLPDRRADEEMLVKFIIGNLSEGLESTFFKSVKKLPGGHNLIVDVHSGSISIDRYYELKVQQSLKRIGQHEAEQHFGALLTDAVQLRLRADVSVGTCLSGGLDSSSIATIAAERYWRDAGRPLDAITACSEQTDNDESRFAEQVANRSSLRWHQVKPNYSDLLSVLPEVIEAQEEPFPSPSIVMQYIVMRKAKQNGISVMLDGQGGDEILLGYDRYLATYCLSEGRANGLLQMLMAIRDCLANNERLSIHRLLGYSIYFNSAEVRWWNYLRRHRYLRVQPEMFEEVQLYSKASRDIHDLQKLEILRTNLPALLRYEDKNSMWHSIETRLPFLDYRLVEFALSLPGSMKIANGWSKYILRRTMKGKMPDDIVWRKSKFGFEAPERLWFARMKDTMFESICSSALLASISQREKLISEFQSLDPLTQWRLYSVACWESAFNITA